MKHNIQFTYNSNSETLAEKKPGAGGFSDRILKPEFQNLKIKFDLGATWLRIVPTISPSIYSWKIDLQVLDYAKGRFIHPKSLIPNKRSVFDIAYGWFKENRPNALYSRENRGGCRLLTDPVLICAVLVQQEQKTVARVLCANAYDGSRGGAPAIGHLIKQAARPVDEHGTVVADAIDPDRGFKLCIEKQQTAGSKYPSYSLRAGLTAAPMEELLASMSAEEAAALCPLESMVQQLTEEEQWECLEQYISKDTVAEIRGTVKSTVLAGA